LGASSEMVSNETEETGFQVESGATLA